MEKAHSKIVKAIIILTSLLIPNISYSAAFGIAEQSALGIGNAFSGGSASATDASTVWFNPAGMTRIQDHQLVTGLHIILPSFNFKNSGSSVLSSFGGAAIEGVNTYDAGRTAYIPNFYFIHSLANDIKLGLGINSPFGMSTKYDDDWVGRYQSIESEILTININPSIAWKFSPNLAIGVGINTQYIKATFNNKIDFTAICASVSLGATTCAALPGSAINDGFSQLEADDWSLGYNVGFLYDLTPHTRLGLSYRSEIHHQLKGTADFTIPITVISTIPILSIVFDDTQLISQPDMPANVSLSIDHQIDSHLTLMADATWTGWSSVPELKIQFTNPRKSDTVEELKFKDTLRLSIGATYTTDGPWIFRTGIAFDEGASVDAHSRSARVPDNDRYWLAVGASYQLLESLSVDFGYAHLFVPDTHIQRLGSTGETLVGEYRADANIISGQIRWDIL